MSPDGYRPSSHRVSSSLQYPYGARPYPPSPPVPTIRRHSLPSADLLSTASPQTRHNFLVNTMNQVSLQPQNLISSPHPHPFSPPCAPYPYTIPLPPQTAEFCPEIHPVLGYPEANSIRYLNLDLNISQSHLWQLLRNGQTRLSKSMDEPATAPPVPSMTIVHPELPWSITVHASGMCGQGVAVADVVQTICRMVQLPLSEHDLSAMSDPQPSLSWVGASRLELLGGKTRLVGFIKLADGAEIWQMIVL